MLYWAVGHSHFLVTVVPLFTGFLVRLVARSQDSNQCQVFSSMVIFTQLLFFGRWLKLFALVFVGLKLDGVLDWSWRASLWPVWVGLGFLMLLSVGMFLLLLGSISSFFTGETEGDELLGLLWLAVSGGGTAGSFLYFIHSVLAEGSVVPAAVVPLVFLLLYILVGVLCFDYLVKLCVVMMLNEDPVEASLGNSGVSTVILEAFRKSPVALIRLSSTFFRPIYSDLPTEKEFYAEKAQAEDERLCLVCLSSPSNAVIMECGHGGLCMDCSLNIWERGGTCHLCRSPIVQVLEVASASPPVFSVISTTRIAFELSS